MIKKNVQTNMKNKFTISNLKYKYNHFHYHVGDFDQLRQEINKVNPPKIKIQNE